MGMKRQFYFLIDTLIDASIGFNNYLVFFQVADMCKNRLLLPSGKVEELYANLSNMNGKIYIQRSRKMQSGTRTRLFAWIMSDLELLALADPSIHGAENVVNIMTEIDCDT